MTDRLCTGCTNRSSTNDVWTNVIEETAFRQIFFFYCLPTMIFVHCALWWHCPMRASQVQPAGTDQESDSYSSTCSQNGTPRQSQRWSRPRLDVWHGGWWDPWEYGSGVAGRRSSQHSVGYETDATISGRFISLKLVENTSFTQADYINWLFFVLLDEPTLKGSVLSIRLTFLLMMCLVFSHTSSASLGFRWPATIPELIEYHHSLIYEKGIQ